MDDLMRALCDCEFTVTVVGTDRCGNLLLCLKRPCKPNPCECQHQHHMPCECKHHMPCECKHHMPCACKPIFPSPPVCRPCPPKPHWPCC